MALFAAVARLLVLLSLPLIPLFLEAPVFAGDRVAGRPFATRSEVIARHGMAATSQPLATQAALEILRAGGSAVDAAIAANAVLGVVEPTGSGIGGDLFAIVREGKSGRLYGLNASGRSPRGLTLEWLRGQGLKAMPSHGPLPVTVPGCVDGWFELHRRFGRLPMEKVLAPAIALAREGFPVSEAIAYYWGRGAPLLEKWPGFRETFLTGGRAPAKGEIFRRPALAATLEKLAAGGRDVFYRGELARTIDAYMKRVGGFLSAADLAAHASDWVEPVSTTYRGSEVWELPPNGQGITVLQMLNILEGYDVPAMGFGSAAYIHHLVEAKKLAFEDRARFIADPAFAALPVGALISKPYAERRRLLIDPRRASLAVEAGNPALEAGDTICLSVADAERNMVSLIQSNYRGFGSGLCPDGLGFCLQDRGELFTLEEGHPNAYAPGKRPFHTIIPAFLTRPGGAVIAFGVMGGAAQPQMHVQVVIDLVDFGMNLQEAGDAPRVLHLQDSEPTGGKMTDGGLLCLESGIPAETATALARLGHRLGQQPGAFGGYQAVLFDPPADVLYGASESRTDGQAAGY